MELVMVVLAWIAIGSGTAASAEMKCWQDIVKCVLVWPLFWFAFVYSFTAGIVPAKCTWCGKTVSGMKDLQAWRNHYLVECDKHPLCERVNKLRSEKQTLITIVERFMGAKNEIE